MHKSMRSIRLSPLIFGIIGALILSTTLIGAGPRSAVAQTYGEGPYGSGAYSQTAPPPPSISQTPLPGSLPLTGGTLLQAAAFGLTLVLTGLTGRMTLYRRRQTRRPPTR
ncbi:MAG: hypothetical protein M3Q71_10375 [Chloroflexota bacterium]|nr:hypothetical protein [Chloroflexota bacterium]